jgi:hypothetical protein
MEVLLLFNQELVRQRHLLPVPLIHLHEFLHLLAALVLRLLFDRVPFRHVRIPSLLLIQNFGIWHLKLLLLNHCLLLLLSTDAAWIWLNQLSSKYIVRVYNWLDEDAVGLRLL